MYVILLFLNTDPSKFAKTTATKAVFGVCVDPQHEEKVASFVENQVSVWDLRWFDKPLHTLPLQKSNIVKVRDVWQEWGDYYQQLTVFKVLYYACT